MSIFKLFLKIQQSFFRFHYLIDMLGKRIIDGNIRFFLNRVLTGNSEKKTEDYSGKDLKTPSHGREVTDLRWVYFKLCRKYLKRASLTEIGKPVNRDHSTVIHGLTQFDLLKDMKFFENNIKIFDYCDLEIFLLTTKEETWMLEMRKKINELTTC